MLSLVDDDEELHGRKDGVEESGGEAETESSVTERLAYVTPRFWREWLFCTLSSNGSRKKEKEGEDRG